MRRVIYCLLVAAVLWFVMFSPWTAPLLNFWGAMTFSAIVLINLGLKAKLCDITWSDLHPRHWHSFFVRLFGKKGETLCLGIGLAFFLWLVFFIGDKASQWLFDFARPQVDTIYAMKDGTPSWLIALLLLLIIGPAEEIFWRGYIQRTLSARFSPNTGFLLATAAYTLVHLPSGNFMLIMAAMLCGICWGGLYRLRPQWFPAIVISHALWDAAAFVWFPF